MFIVLSLKKAVRLWNGEHQWAFLPLQAANNSQTTHGFHIPHGYPEQVAS